MSSPIAPGANSLPTANIVTPAPPTRVDRSKVDPAIVKAAEGMESMFLDHMMKVMRQTVPKNEMDLESPATDIYRSMLDTEYADKAAHTGGVGLSDLIIAYMQGNKYTKESTGGTHAGQSTDDKPNSDSTKLRGR